MPLRNTTFTIPEIHRMFTSAEKLFFIGIGGISMSAMAEFSSSFGKEIYGYDKERTPLCERLEKVGKIKYFSTPDNVKGMDLVIFTNAINEQNYEYKQAKRKNIPLISRANFLGYLISLHKQKIGVCGMHGKSTVTSMLGHIFYCAEENPTVFCGAEMENFHSNFKFGGRACCIFEACEYQNSFLSLPTNDAVILNIDYDHPDFFSNIEQVKESFKSYIRDAKRVFLNCDDKNARELCHKNTVTFGFDKCAIYRGEIASTSKSGTEFKIFYQGKYLCQAKIFQHGRHMVYNALCAFAVAHSSRIPIDKIIQALFTFKGNKRRMEFIQKNDTGADIFEDYAHHPTEITASLSSLKEQGYKSILCVFQPHTFSRTHFLYKQFTSAFCDADKLIIASTFSAREENIFELSEEKFATDCGGELVTSIKEIAHRVEKTDCDCVVLMGAGDLTCNLRKQL